MALIDDLRRRIGAVPTLSRDAAGWRAGVVALRARTGASEADVARAVRLVVQARSEREPLAGEPEVRALARLLFVDTAERRRHALVAVPMLLDLVEQGRGTLDEAVEYALGVVGAPH
jgi:hypothetical protein